MLILTFKNKKKIKSRKQYTNSSLALINLTKKIKMGFSVSVLSLTVTLLPSVASANSHKATSLTEVPNYISAKTEVSVSNYPLFLLSEAVTKGAPSAKLLLDAGDIGHHGSLSPGDMKTVSDSRYVVWFGKDLETNLVKPFTKSPNTIALFDLKGFKKLPFRDIQGHPIKGTLDPHIWLDPENAKAITRALGAIYSRANPKYKEIYAKNVRAFAIKMDAAVQQVHQSSNIPSKKVPYWAYHDAFQYIEATLNIDMVGALSADHNLPPKASQFRWLKKTRPQENMCIVLQSDNNKGVLSKLKPIRSSIQQEDMSNTEDFITGWLSIALDINKCVQNH